MWKVSRHWVNSEEVNEHSSVDFFGLFVQVRPRSVKPGWQEDTCKYKSAIQLQETQSALKQPPCWRLCSLKSHMVQYVVSLLHLTFC